MPVAFVFPNSWASWLTVIGLAITIVLYVRKVPAALIISIVITSILAFIVGVTTIPAGGLIQAPRFDTLLQFDLTKVFGTLGVLGAILTIFTMMLTDFFDTMGTATAITEQAGLTTRRRQGAGHRPRPAGRQRRRHRRWRRWHQLEHELHRERRRRRGGRPNGRRPPSSSAFSSCS